MLASPSIPQGPAQWLKTVPGVVGKATLALPKRLDAAGRTRAAGTASISAISSASCNRCSGDFRGRLGEGCLTDAELRQRAWEAAAQVVDPEIPVLTIADLGVLRDVAVSDGQVEVAITPTYSGCPGDEHDRAGNRTRAGARGIAQPKIRTVLSPAWTTDWMSEEGRRKLREYGIAPPQAHNSRRALFGEQQVACPQCGSDETEVLSEFGSTSCKALWRCRRCREPFDYFKCH